MRLLLELCAPLLQELNKKETITAAAASTIDVHMLLNAPRIVVRKEPFAIHPPVPVEDPCGRCLLKL